MKKLVCAVMTLMLMMSAVAAHAMSLEEFYPSVQWEFGVPLYELQSEYAMLVNADNLLEKDFEPDPLIKVTGIKRATSAAVYMEATAAEALKSMFEAASEVKEYTYINEKGKEKVAKYDEEQGMVLYLKSGYRSYGTQATTYANYLARNNNVDDGYVAKPGSSEHQTGICADILNEDYAGRSRMTQDFKHTPEAQWMKENCAEFGFILRFTEDGEAETGIKFEPWHFRYVGKTIAEYVMGKGITYEVFMEDAKAAMDAYVANGGDLEEQLAYENFKMNMPPMSFVLEQVDEEGDAEVSLVF